MISIFDFTDNIIFWQSTAGVLAGLSLLTVLVYHRGRRNLKASLSETLRRQQAAELQWREEKNRATELQTQIRILETKVTETSLNSQNIRQDFERRLQDRAAEIRERDQKILDLEKRRTELEGVQASRMEEYNNQIRLLVQAREDLNLEKKKIREDEEAARLAKDAARQAHWQNHERAVIENLRNLCARLNLVSFEQDTFPLAKKPDFAIEMGEQLIVFDAKAPADPAALDHFPEYLRKQAEAMEKYLKQEGVRREGFLVVPSDVVGGLKDRFCFEIGGFKIFVVTCEALEAIVRLFIKISEFEILESVDPDAQEDLANYLARVSRVLKRRLQIDQYMSHQFLDILMSGEALPHQIMEMAKAKEKTFSVNPPRTVRGKAIALTEIAEEQKKISATQKLLDIDEISEPI